MVVEKFVLAVLLRIIISYFYNPKYIKNKEFLEKNFNALPTTQDDVQTINVKMKPSTPTRKSRTSSNNIVSRNSRASEFYSTFDYEAYADPLSSKTNNLPSNIGYGPDPTSYESTDHPLGTDYFVEQ